MKLILFLIFCLMHLSSQERDCRILGKLSKNVKQTTTDMKHYYCVYIDINEFPNDSEIPIKATIYEGIHTENVMYYGDIGHEPNSTIVYTLFYPITSNTYSSSGYSSPSGSYYNYHSIYFRIPKEKLKLRYLIVSIPYFNAKKSEIEISAGFPFWAIITIASVGSVIFIAAIIITIVCCIKKHRKRNNYISPLPSSDDTAPINPPENETY